MGAAGSSFRLLRELEDCGFSGSRGLGVWVVGCRDVGL